MSKRAVGNRLTGPMGVSALLHLSIATLVIWAVRDAPPVKLPPMYKVDLVAAPPGPRAIGEVRSDPDPATSDAPAPKMREVAPTPDKAPTVNTKKAPPAAKKVTPSTSTAKAKANTKAPKAGGGPKGGTGSDVASVKTQGIDFPYPGYLNNIVRQIALNFNPRNPDAPLKAEIAFLIHRDGTVTNLRFVTRSGVYTFDLEAQGAVEKASKSFGPLPAGFENDVLPIVFSFDPKILQ